MDNAHKLMTVEFREQLSYYEAECSPRVGDNILAKLAIYANASTGQRSNLHTPNLEIQTSCGYGVFDPKTTSLNKVASGDEDFPVRFAPNCKYRHVVHKS